MSLSNYLENALLNHLRGGAALAQPAALYLKLHVGDPGEDCTANAAAHTVRQPVTFGAAANGTITSNVAVTWPNIGTPGQTYTHISMWDAATGGNPLGSGQLVTQQTIPANTGFTIPSTNATFSLD